MEINKESVQKFIDDQLRVWDTARGNYEALNRVEVKNLRLGDAEVKVQFNPARIVSSAAKVDKASLKARACFLCAENRPAVQEGLPWGNYTVLINPFPIFPKHLTIPCNQHTDQRINAERIGDMLELARMLEGFTLFYNGPKCGASAPDHFHFQAGNRGFMPIEDEQKTADAKVLEAKDGAEIALIESLGRPFFRVRSTDKKAAERMFACLFKAMNTPEGEPEPMLNILCWYEGGEWTLLVFPRKKHRPSCYFAEGDANILLSPASVDMGGVFITPLEKDFRKITADDIRMILAEVCLGKDEAEQLADKLLFD